MALSLNQQFAVATEAAFRNKLAMALAGYADDVMAETQTAMTGVDYNGTSEAQARTALATQVIRDAVGVADRLKFYLAAKGAALTIPPDVEIVDFINDLSDVAISSFISSNWSELAGWRERDTPEPV